MRASTVFAIALALLVGLAAAATAKYAGLFNKKEAAAAVAAAAAPVRVLAPKVNLYREVTVTSDQVMVIDLGPEAQTAMAKAHGPEWKDKLMPPIVTAAHLRVARKNLNVGQPLFNADFEDSDLPPPLASRLDPGMRAVNVTVPKDKAGGGLIRAGEAVDVLLTTKIVSDGREEFRTASLARGCKVVTKRNNLWQVMASDPDDKPLHFTLQANPYRAALIEYAQAHGQISLQPVSTGTSPADAANAEFDADRQRSDAIIGDDDLRRIFNLPKPLPPAQRPRPAVIEHFSGISEAGRTVIHVPAGSPAAETTAPASPAAATSDGATQSGATQGGYNFQLPSATGETGCKDCDAKKKAAEKAAAAAKYGTFQPK